MNIIFECGICGGYYDTQDEALNCEKTPVFNPYKIRVGDIVFVNAGLFNGDTGRIDHLQIQHRSHRICTNVFMLTGPQKSCYGDWIELDEHSLIPIMTALAPEIAEQMGAAVHEAWMAKRKADKGWHSPDECPEKARLKGTKVCQICASWNEKLVQGNFKCDKGHTNDGTDCPDYKMKNCPQCHDCMRPYSELPDNEKDLDRQYPLLFMEILKDRGLMITRIPERK